MEVRVKVSYIASATEDERRISERLKELFGEEFSIERLEGHWKNPIFLISSELRGKKAKDALKKIISSFGTKSLRDRYDEEEKRITIKLDKLELYSGNLALGRGAKIEIKFISFSKLPGEEMERWLDELEDRPPYTHDKE